MSTAVLTVKSKPTQFEIVDEDERLVSGWASVEVVDLQGDIVPISELKRAMYKFMDRGGFIMYGHSNKPVGKVLQWEVEKFPGTDVYGIKFVAKIFKDYPIDDEVWKLIKAGELRGFSIGAQAKEEKMMLKDEKSGLPKEVGVLHDLNLMEISICKEPANPLAIVEEVNYFAKSADELKKEEQKVEKKRKPWELPKPKTQRKIVEFKGLDELKKMAEKALDDWIEVMKPFGKWKNFADCVRDMKSRGYSEDSAKRICGKLQAELEKQRRFGEPKTEEERARTHFNISEEEWSRMSEDEKRRYIEMLPPRGARIEAQREEKQERTGDIEPIDLLGRKPKREAEDVQIKELVKSLPPDVVSELLAKKAEIMLTEKAEDRRPPKAWWDYCVRRISESNPDYTDEQVRAVCGSMWHHGWGIGSPKGRREHGG